MIVIPFLLQPGSVARRAGRGFAERLRASDPAAGGRAEGAGPQADRHQHRPPEDGARVNGGLPRQPDQEQRGGGRLQQGGGGEQREVGGRGAETAGRGESLS